MNATMTIELGTYKLSRHVDNPSPDKRKSRDWKARVSWEAGQTFVIREVPIFTPGDAPMPLGSELSIPGAIGGVPLSDVRALAVMPYLVAIKERPSQWLLRMDYGTTMAPEIVDHLVKIGAITWDQFESAYRHCLEGGDDESTGI
jgi:hypothetical protein